MRSFASDLRIACRLEDDVRNRRNLVPVLRIGGKSLPLRILAECTPRRVPRRHVGKGDHLNQLGIFEPMTVSPKKTGVRPARRKIGISPALNILSLLSREPYVCERVEVTLYGFTDRATLPLLSRHLTRGKIP